MFAQGCFKISRTQRHALVIYLVALFVFTFPLSYNLLWKPFFIWIPAIDIVSSSLLPIEILLRGDFTLDAYWDFFNANFRDPYFVTTVDGRTVSRYPVAAAVIATPFYGITLGTGWLYNTGKDWLTFPGSVFFPAKFAAASMTALAVVMLFFCARELTNLRKSTALAFIFGFGTSVWSTASQALWQQTPSILFQLIGIWFVLRGRRKGAQSVVPAAFFFSAAIVARMNNIFTVLIWTLYILIEYRSIFWRWILWAMPPLLLALVYNTLYNGSPIIFGYHDGFVNLLSLPRVDGLLGLLLSPSRGLLVYSPFLILSVAGFWHARRGEQSRFYLFAALTFTLSLLVLSGYQFWDGGWGYGTRMLVDALPYATLLLIPVLPLLRGWQIILFGIGVLYAMVLQSFGLWDYGARWHWFWYERGGFQVWNLTYNEPLFYLRQYIEMANQFIQRWLLR